MTNSGRLPSTVGRDTRTPAREEKHSAVTQHVAERKTATASQA
jgi:hypothetical protein